MGGFAAAKPGAGRHQRTVCGAEILGRPDRFLCRKVWTHSKNPGAAG